MRTVLRSGDHLWLLKGEGELVVARATPRAFEPLATYRVSDGPTWSMPAITERLVLVRHGGDLSAWALD